MSLSAKPVYLCYLCPRLGISKINKQGYGLIKKGHMETQYLARQEGDFSIKKLHLTKNLRESKPM